MLKDATQVIPTIAVSNIEDAKKFYGETLGLSVVNPTSADGGIDFGTKGSELLHVFPKESVNASDNTVAMFAVADVAATVDDIKSRGATFETFDMPNVTWEGDVATMGEAKGAWLKDPDGNWLAIFDKTV